MTCRMAFQDQCGRVILAGLFASQRVYARVCFPSTLITACIRKPPFDATRKVSFVARVACTPSGSTQRGKVCSFDKNRYEKQHMEQRVQACSLDSLLHVLFFSYDFAT